MPPASVSRVCAFSYQMITSLPADQLQTFSTAEKYSILFRRGQAPLETKRHLFRSPSGYQSRKQDTNQNGNGDSKTLFDSTGIIPENENMIGHRHVDVFKEPLQPHQNC